MPYSFNETTSAGATNVVSVPFPYLSKADVHVSLDGVEVAQGSLVWLTSSTIQLPYSAGSLTGKLIRVYRVTDLSEPTVTFSIGGVDPADLNAQVLQLLYVTQEAYDAALSALRLESNTYSAGGHRIINVADPTGNQDAATKLWVLTGALANLDAYVAARVAVVAAGTIISAASNVSFAPGGSLAANTVQGAIAEASADTDAVIAALAASDAVMASFIGCAFEYYGSALPSTRFIWANGQNLSRTTYAVLFARYGTTYGVGNGTTTFGMPDRRGRFSAGRDDMGGTPANRLTNATMTPGGATLGGTGGSQTVTLSLSHLPIHNHAYSGTTSPGTLGYAQTTVNNSGATLVLNAVGGGGGASVPGMAYAGNTANEGGGAALGIIPPALIANIIIYTGVP